MNSVAAPPPNILAVAWGDVPSWVSAVGTVGGLIAAGIAACFVYGQLKELREQNQRQKKAADKRDAELHRVRNAQRWFRSEIWLRAIDDADLGFHVRIHDLRHAHASWLLASGASLQAVKERLGHTDIATTARYLHTLPDTDQTALDALDKMRRPKFPRDLGKLD